MVPRPLADALLDGAEGVPPPLPVAPPDRDAPPLPDGTPLSDGLPLAPAVMLNWADAPALLVLQGEGAGEALPRALLDAEGDVAPETLVGGVVEGSADCEGAEGAEEAERATEELKEGARDGLGASVPEAGVALPGAVGGAVGEAPPLLVGGAPLEELLGEPSLHEVPETEGEGVDEGGGEALLARDPEKGTESEGGAVPEWRAVVPAEGLPNTDGEGGAVARAVAVPPPPVSVG